MDDPVSHVLYISHECKVCHALRGRGIPTGVRIENVMDIIPRPAWLDGTPTLVDVSVGVLYKGSDALIVMEHMRQKQARASVFREPPPQPPPPQQPPPQLPANMPRVPDRPMPPKPVAKGGESEGKSWKDLFTQPIIEPTEPDAKPVRIGEDSVGEMLSRRAMGMK